MALVHFRAHLAQLESNLIACRQDYKWGIDTLQSLHIKSSDERRAAGQDVVLVKDFKDYVGYLVEQICPAQHQQSDIRNALLKLQYVRAGEQQFESIAISYCVGGVTTWATGCFIATRTPLDEIAICYCTFGFSFSMNENWKLLQGFWETRRERVSGFMRYKALLHQYQVINGSLPERLLLQ